MIVSGSLRRFLAHSMNDSPRSGAGKGVRLRDWVALNLLPGLGPIRLRRLLEQVDDPGVIAFDLDLETLVRLGAPRGDAEAQRLERALGRTRRGLAGAAERELARCARRGIRPIPIEAPEFPPSLRMLPDAPPLLYVQGTLPAEPLGLAIIGSRRATRYGIRIAQDWAMGLASRGVTIVSGGARGIDAAAHRGALEGGGTTVAVLGSGLAQPYPLEHRDLFERIATQGGAVLSEFPLDTAPKAERFPRRNRLVSGLAAAVLVVEAAARSGTQITVGCALDQSKEVLAVPGPIHGQSEGCHRLIQQGAKLVHDMDDVLEELPDPQQLAKSDAASTMHSRPAPDLEHLDDDERRVLSCLDPLEPRHVDPIFEAARLPIGRLQAALLRLHLRGAVDPLPGGYYLSVPTGPSSGSKQPEEPP